MSIGERRCEYPACFFLFLHGFWGIKMSYEATRNFTAAARAPILPAPQKKSIKSHWVPSISTTDSHWINNKRYTKSLGERKLLGWMLAHLFLQKLSFTYLAKPSFLGSLDCQEPSYQQVKLGWSHGALGSN